MAKPSIPFYQDPELYRPQTWLLLLATLFTLITTLASLWGFTLQDIPQPVLLYGHKVALPIDAATSGPHPVTVPAVFGTALFAMLCPLYTVMRFKHRRTQATFCLLCALAQLALVAVGYYNLHQFQELLAALQPGPITPQLGLALPLLACITCLVARSYIRKDERRIQRMNRLW